MGNTVAVLLAGGQFALGCLRPACHRRKATVRVVGEAFSPPIAIAIAKQERPQLVLSDCRHDCKVFVESILEVTQETRWACLLVGNGSTSSNCCRASQGVGFGTVVMENDDPET